LTQANGVNTFPPTAVYLTVTCHKATQLDTNQKSFTLVHRSVSEVRMNSQFAAKFVDK